MRALVLVNPLAGRRTGLATWRRLEGHVPHRRSLEVVIPASVEEVRQAARQAVRAGVDRVIAVGGDGTVNAVAGELSGTGTALGVIPAGTGNDFCRNLGLPLRPEAALAVALGAQTRPVDVGLLPERRCFLNVAGLGFDAEVAARAARMPRGTGGAVPYLLAALATAQAYRARPAVVTVDGARYEQPCLMVAVANGRGYAGGMQVAPLARPDDGLFDVCLVGELRRWEILLLLRKVFSGGHMGHPQIRFLRGARVQVAMERGTRSHLDGEPYALDRLEAEVGRGALLVAGPPALAERPGAGGTVAGRDSG